ncbi:MAG: MFS transporter small subunit [Bradyrhizobium sp.]
MATQTDSSMTLKLILAWGFVGIPLAWGVIETCFNAAKLFH